jgi:hypothetical protein
MRLCDRVGLVIVTTIAGILDIFGGVACPTLHLSLAAMIEREIMLFQECRRPGFCRVAVVTHQAEEPGVNLRLCMALDADSGSSPEAGVGVALLAADFPVSPIQGKYLGVIESMHAVHTIMTTQAGGAKRFLVLFHKALILI